MDETQEKLEKIKYNSSTTHQDDYRQQVNALRSINDELKVKLRMAITENDDA